MRRSFKYLTGLSLFVVAILLNISNFTGKPLFSMDIFKKDSDSATSISGMDKIKDKIFNTTEEETIPESAIIYRWKNKDGVWTYSNYPNVSGDYETIKINPRQNVLRFKESDESDSTQAAEKSKAGGSAPKNNISLLIHKAKNVQNVLDARAQRQQARIDTIK